MGRGRPARHGERKQTLSIRVTPTVRRFLESRAESASDEIELTIRRTAAFREWARDDAVVRYIESRVDGQ